MLSIRRVPLLALIVLLGLSGPGCRTTYAVEPLPTRGDVAETAEDVTPLLIGQTLPSLELRDAKGKSHSLHGLVKGKKTVLIFYRGGWCPFCNRHLAGVAQALPELREAGVQVIAVSPDKPAKLAETATENELGYLLLSDSDMALTKAMGLAFQVDDATIEKYKGYNIDLAAYSGKQHHQLPVPATYVVGPDARVTFSYVNPDYKVRLKKSLLLAAIAAVED